MNTKNNEGPQPWIDPALEARVVAGVLDETSAFETAELDRVLAKNPELAIFKRRIEAVHALVGAAVRPEAPRIQLSPDRRQQLLEKLGARPRGPKRKVFVLPRPFWWSSRNLIAVAASLVIGAIVVTFFGTMVVFQSKQEPPDFEGESGGFTEYGNAPAAGVVANVPPPSIATMPPISGPVNTISTTASTAPMAPMFSMAIPNGGGTIAANGIASTRAAVAMTKPSIVQQPQEMAQLKKAERSSASLDQVGPDSAGPSSKPGSSAGQAGDGLTVAQASAIKAFTGGWGKGSGSGTVARGKIAKDEDRKQDAGDLSARSGAALPIEVAKNKPMDFAINDAAGKERSPEENAPLPTSGQAPSTVDYGTPVPGKPGFVTSPYSPYAGYVDVRGFPPGTEVKDPYTGKSFQVSGDGTANGGTLTSGTTASAFASNAPGGMPADTEKQWPPIQQGSNSQQADESAELRSSGKKPKRVVTDVFGSEEKPTGDKSVADLAPEDLPARQPLQEAQAFYASGRYDLAAKRYSQILNIDPDNTAARKGMEEVNSAKAKYYETAYNEARGDKVRQVNKAWELPVRKFDAAAAQKAPQPKAQPTFQTEIAAAKQPFSTFSLHVSDVSFQLAKDALARGAMPDPDRIRAEEFYNAFDYGDPAPAPGEEVACRIEQCAHPFLQQRDLVRIALKVAAAGRAAGQPLRLTILLDTSGSMEREDRAASVRRALGTLASLLGPNDRVTLIGFARTPRLLAEQVPGDQASKLVEIAARTPSEGGTNLELALGLASELALKQKIPAAQNRIVLLTDGAANLGDADPARLARQIEKTRQLGISFDACGVGANGLNDEILEALTRKGDGRYYFLNKPEDADAGFARQLAGALRPAAENVKVQVVFNPGRVSQYRLIGFEKHLLKKEDFRNDKVQAAELSAEEAGVAVYQVQTLPEGDGELGEVFVRFRDPANGQMIEHSWTMPYDAKAPSFDKAAPSMQLAATAALLAEKLRGDSQVDLNALAPVITNLRGQYPHQAKVADLIRMFEQMRR